MKNSDRPIAVWLLICCVLIFAMVVLGGVTRLTQSGLSMVEWDPIMGVLPPLTGDAWQATFEKYQQFPEYQKINRGMSLGEFKTIFWMEYAHRILGRLIGIVFLVPFLYFLMRRQIRRELIPRLVVMFVLGGLQGLLGWYMVKSGLVDKPHVSQYRLTAHLMLAFAIYAYMYWTALGLWSPAPRAGDRRDQATTRRLGWLVTAGVVLLAITGGFVAGTKAGFAFNTFPLMQGRWLPPGYLAMEPVWRNLFENIATIQFNHRWLAMLLAILIAGFWWRVRRVDVAPRARTATHLLLVMLVIQIALGITTLLWVVPVPLGSRPSHPRRLMAYAGSDRGQITACRLCGDFDCRFRAAWHLDDIGLAASESEMGAGGTACDRYHLAHQCRSSGGGHPAIPGHPWLAHRQGGGAGGVCRPGCHRSALRTYEKCTYCRLAGSRRHLRLYRAGGDHPFPFSGRNLTLW